MPSSGRGRAESALNSELRARQELGKAERAALRVQARALDAAETSGDVRLVSDTLARLPSSRVRRAAGARHGRAPSDPDPFEDLMRVLSTPAMGDAAPA